MDEIEDIKTRTFGVEIEMCDFDRSKVTLPYGFEWNKDESIYNTDGTCNSKFGGEINTPPLLYCEDSFCRMHQLYNDLEQAGGRLKWCIYTHVHLYAGDLDYEHLKNLVLFQYHTYSFFKQYVQLGPWDEDAMHLCPRITDVQYERIKSATSFSELRNALTNQSKKGFVRYSINVASYFVRKTVEFRCFNASQDFDQVANCVTASYRMFYYALNHTEEDFKNICSVEDFVEKIGLPTNLPPIMVPLLYQGNPYNAKDAFMTSPILCNSKRCSCLEEALTLHKVKDLAVVNSFMFQYEMNLWRKFNLTIYNQDGYSHLLYKLATGQTKVHYNSNLEWLQKYNSDDPVRQVAIALYVSRVMKFVDAKNEYTATMKEACMQKAEESIAKTEPSAKRLVEMLTSVKYVNGNLKDAVEDNKAVFFSIGKYKNSRRALRTIVNNSDYESDVQERVFSYYNFVEDLKDDVHFYMFSNSPYLSNMHKLALFRNAGVSVDSAGQFLYSNKSQDQAKASTSYEKAGEPLEVCLPPDDLDICDPKKLKIGKIPSAKMYELQKRFIVKVDKVSRPVFCYAVMYDKYLLGGVGFEFAKSNAHDVWQLTDFSTNNKVPRLSKLILMCILSRDLQRMLSRSMQRIVEKAITYAYTSAPVSMKYRGLYKKNKELCTPTKLAYEGELGKYKSMEEIIQLYQKSKNDAGR